MSLKHLKTVLDKNGSVSTSLEAIFQNAATISDFAAGYFSRIGDLLLRLDLQAIQKMVETIIAAGNRGNTIYVFGNGGSAALATHFANDLSVGVRAPGAPPFRVVSLSDNLAVVTALANDEGYDHVFVRQLEELGCGSGSFGKRKFAQCTQGPEICRTYRRRHHRVLRL